MSRFYAFPLHGDADRARAAESDGIVYNADGTRPPLVCIRTWSTENDHYLSLARALGPDQPIVTLSPPDHARLEQYPRTTDEWVEWLLPTYRALDLRGDRLLGGFSFGGVVALELAERLVREGESVALVLMLDTRRPKARPETKPGARVPMRLQRFARGLLAYSQIETRRERLAHLRDRLDPRRILARRSERSARREARRQRKRGKRERRAADIARAVDKRPEGLVATRFTGEQMSYLQRTVHVVYLKYRGHPTTLPIALLRTAESVERSGNDPALGWHPLAQGPFSAETVAGSHWTLFEPSHLPALAARVDALLRSALASKAP